jgi:CDP-diacylglycerol--glycerol-3-phosphate 3-phosphatidyltransferase
MFFTLPTLITWARIAAIPLIVGVFYLPIDPPLRNLLATVLFVASALTDWLDGWLARRLNQTSTFGAFLDPVADKFLVCASLLVPWWRWSSSGARLRSRHCANGWRRSARRAASRCTCWAR